MATAAPAATKRPWIVEFYGSAVGKKYAITSIPYSKITSVSVVSNKSWGGSFFSTGAIAIHVGTHTYEVEFRGDQKSHHVHNVILHFIS